ncbi:hypothetical protein KKH39_01145 [Patescibacteria group bacterium]|nr:hypothetical protein [Patescibacteria group bacterium]
MKDKAVARVMDGDLVFLSLEDLGEDLLVRLGSNGQLDHIMTSDGVKLHIFDVYCVDGFSVQLHSDSDRHNALLKSSIGHIAVSRSFLPPDFAG